MYGAILGDMIGAPYEFDRGDKTKDFPLFCKYSEFTDDTVITIAVAEALIDTLGQSDDDIKDAVYRLAWKQKSAAVQQLRQRLGNARIRGGLDV